MSQVIIEDAGWAAIMADPQLQRARSKLSFHEIRLIVNHARAFRKHDFWGAGEAGCPREIKAGDGELHTLRCKVCGEDNPRDDRCLGASPNVVSQSAVERPSIMLEIAKASAEQEMWERRFAVLYRSHPSWRTADKDGPWGLRDFLMYAGGICGFDVEPRKLLESAALATQPDTGLREADALHGAALEIVELREALERLLRATKPIAARVFNDNGDLTINTAPFDGDEISSVYFADRAARAVLASQERTGK